MTYKQLTIDQRIGLKGFFKTAPDLHAYRAVWVLWDFKTAVEFFLNNDINLLHDKASRNKSII